MEMPYSMMLDAGHGGRDPGAVYQGRQEKDDNLSLVLAIGEILQENGVDVEYTRTTDIYQTPYEKAMIANRAEVDFFYLFIEILIRRIIRCQVWRAWYMTCLGLNMRWHRTSMNNWRQ